MRGHNICFCAELTDISLIITKYTLLSRALFGLQLNTGTVPCHFKALNKLFIIFSYIQLTLIIPMYHISNFFVSFNIMYTELHERGSIEDNSKIIFRIS